MTIQRSTRDDKGLGRKREKPVSMSKPLPDRNTKQANQMLIDAINRLDHDGVTNAITHGAEIGGGYDKFSLPPVLEFAKALSEACYEAEKQGDGAVDRLVERALTIAKTLITNGVMVTAEDLDGMDVVSNLQMIDNSKLKPIITLFEIAGATGGSLTPADCRDDIDTWNY